MADTGYSKPDTPAPPEVGEDIPAGAAGLDESDRLLARERAEVAARLHDGPAQELTALRMLVFLLARELSQSRSELIERTDAILCSADTAIGQIKTLTGELRTLSSMVAPFAALLRKCCSAVRDNTNVDFACSRRAETVDSSCPGAAAILDCLPSVLRVMAGFRHDGNLAVIAYVVGTTLRIEIVMADAIAPDSRFPDGLEPIRTRLADCGGMIAMTRAEALDKCVIVAPVQLLATKGEEQ